MTHSKEFPSRERLVEIGADAIWKRLDHNDEIGRVGIIPNRFNEAMEHALQAMLRELPSPQMHHASFGKNAENYFALMAMKDGTHHAYPLNAQQR